MSDVRDPPPPARTLVVGLGLIALLAVAFGTRFVATWGGARLDGQYVLSADSDPYYHFHRLTYLYHQHAPLVVDYHAAAPARFECVWPVALEYIALLLDRAVFGAERDLESLLLIAGFVPVLFGLAAILAAFAASLRATSPGAALAGAAALAIVPGAIHVSSFSLFDHHCVELLIVVALPAIAARALLAHPAAAATGGFVSLGLSVLAADATYLVMASFGASALLLALRGGANPERDRGLAPFLVGGLGGVVSASALEVALGLPRLLPHGGRIGLMLAVVGAGLLVGARVGRRIAGIACLLVAAPLTLPTVLTAVRYLTATADAISPNIAEAIPIWRNVPAPRIAVYCGLALLTIVQAWRRRGDAREAFPSLAAAGAAVIGLVQRKYLFLLGAAVAWAISRTVHDLVPAAPGRRRLAAQCAIAVVLCGVVVERTGHAVAIAPSDVSPGDVAFARLARLIDQRLPPQTPFVPGSRPAWAIAVEPSLGPRALHLGGRAVTALPFWGTPELAGQFQRTLLALLAGDEAEAHRLLDGLSARFVLISDLEPLLPFVIAATGRPPASFTRPEDERAAIRGALWYRLHHLRGAASEDGVPALGRFRLVASAGHGTDGLALFERVPGAEIAGTAPPGARVLLFARIHSPDGEDFTWVATAPTDAAGRFALRVPYATEEVGGRAHAVELRVRCPGREFALAVPESAVASGWRVAADCS
ncbi:MAG: hypothetical protein EXR72_01330 [Myxococcales bacterium]|nr:hypothetical protein [Myxococcales bacterium]